MQSTTEDVSVLLGCGNVTLCLTALCICTLTYSTL